MDPGGMVWLVAARERTLTVKQLKDLAELNRLHFERGEEGYVALDWSERMDVALEKKRALRHEQVERWRRGRRRKEGRSEWLRCRKAGGVDGDDGAGDGGGGVRGGGAGDCAGGLGAPVQSAGPGAMCLQRGCGGGAGAAGGAAGRGAGGVGGGAGETWQLVQRRRTDG